MISGYFDFRIATNDWNQSPVVCLIIFFLDGAIVLEILNLIPDVLDNGGKILERLMGRKVGRRGWGTRMTEPNVIG